MKPSTLFDSTRNAPGASVSFAFNVIAPATVGTYNFQWRMVQDGVQWFGAKSPDLTIAVGTSGGAVRVGTHKASSDEELERAIKASGLERGRNVAIEEFIEGHEGFYDTITVDGKRVDAPARHAGH